MDVQAYRDFIESKNRRFKSRGVKYQTRNGRLFGFQSDLVERALDKGRYAIFADCGLGKTLMELEWCQNTPGRALILAPLAVAHQIEREAERFGYDAKVGGNDCGSKITLTNYEKLHQIDPGIFDAVALDESSILKSYTGKTRTALIESFAGHKFKLCATATPSPNDFMELGNHAQFLGAMTRQEMLSMFFVHDGGSTQNWRLKGHAKADFWKWVGSWAAMIRAPSDMGYPDEGFSLPEMKIHHQVVESEFRHHALIPGAALLDLRARRAARRGSISERVSRAVDLVDDNPWLFWCDLNDESKAIASAVPGCVEVTGSDDDEKKKSSLCGFADGSIDRLVTKPKIGGWGMNWQACNNMAFVGMSDSYESFYQATRRCWRFGQTKPVDVHLIYSEHESAVIENILRKESDHKAMQDALVLEVNR